MLAEMLIQPAGGSKKYLNMASYCFLIESQDRQRKALFDLAFMKDFFAEMPPALKAMFAGNEEVMGIDEFQDIPETLKCHGIDLSAINSIIWSHSHVDHTGDPSVFPPSTELVVGPGFQGRPGFPTNPDAFVLDSAFQGRAVREIDFSTTTVVIGGFRAYDFLGDGSFWLLEAPGHTAHHMCALCRTTPDSWVFLGGDTCHNVAQIRPNQYTPLPDELPAIVFGGVPPSEEQSNFQMSTIRQHDREAPFFGFASAMQEDPTDAMQTVKKVQALDARDDVMAIFAHDATLLDVLDFFPQDINDWKARDWASTARWLFLRDLEAFVHIT